jgi:hypothetical protein
MPPCAQTLRRLAVASLASLAVARADPQLAAKSPFLPVAGPGAAAPATNAPLEYRGLMQTAEGLKVRIVDPSRRGGAAGVWLRANERDPNFDFVVKKIDLERDTVTLDYQGRPLTLAQRVAKVASAGAPQMPPPGMPGPASNVPPAITNSVVVNPTPADEQRRLEAVAAEVARRRQLREQAAQQVGQGAPAASPNAALRPAPANPQQPRGNQP